MERAALEEGVEFDLLKTSWSAGALLVASADVAGRGLALGLGLRAFEDDDFAWHKIWGREARLFFPKVKRLICPLVRLG